MKIFSKLTLAFGLAILGSPRISAADTPDWVGKPGSFADWAEYRHGKETLYARKSEVAQLKKLGEKYQGEELLKQQRLKAVPLYNINYRWTSWNPFKNSGSASYSGHILLLEKDPARAWLAPTRPIAEKDEKKYALYPGREGVALRGLTITELKGDKPQPPATAPAPAPTPTPTPTPAPPTSPEPPKTYPPADKPGTPPPPPAPEPTPILNLDQALNVLFNKNNNEDKAAQKLVRKMLKLRGENAEDKFIKQVQQAQKENSLDALKKQWIEDMDKFCNSLPKSGGAAAPGNSGEPLPQATASLNKTQAAHGNSDEGVKDAAQFQTIQNPAVIVPAQQAGPRTAPEGQAECTEWDQSKPGAPPQTPPGGKEPPPTEGNKPPTKEPGTWDKFTNGVKDFFSSNRTVMGLGGAVAGWAVGGLAALVLGLSTGGLLLVAGAAAAVGFGLAYYFSKDKD